jgi:hypothetical protein
LERAHRVADWANLDYNMAPSFHVALAVCCASANVCQAPPYPHRHHLLDGVLGWAVEIASLSLARKYSRT